MSDFDKYYYDHCCGAPYVRNDHWVNFFGGIAQHVIQDIHPASVLDAGCAMGFLVEGLRTRGVQAFGIDISEYAIQNVHPDIQTYCKVGSITDAFPQRYDLIISIEVLEHMPKDQAETAIRNFCSATDDILFSSTPFDYKEITHFNVQPPEYWAEQFARHGFFRDVDFDASFITPWAVRFRRGKDPLYRTVGEYERKFVLLQKESADLRALNYDMRLQISKNEDQLRALQADADRARLELSELQSSWSGRIASWLRRFRIKFVPPASRREKFVSSILKLFT